MLAIWVKVRIKPGERQRFLKLCQYFPFRYLPQPPV